MPSDLGHDLEAQQNLENEYTVMIIMTTIRSIVLRIHVTVQGILNEPVRMPEKGFPLFAVVVYVLSAVALTFHEYYPASVSMALLLVNTSFLFLIASLPDLEESRGVIKPIISTLIVCLGCSKFL